MEMTTFQIYDIVIILSTKIERTSKTLSSDRYHFFQVISFSLCRGCHLEFEPATRYYLKGRLQLFVLTRSHMPWCRFSFGTNINLEQEFQFSFLRGWVLFDKWRNWCEIILQRRNFFANMNWQHWHWQFIVNVTRNAEGVIDFVKVTKSEIDVVKLYKYIKLSN